MIIIRVNNGTAPECQFTTTSGAPGRTAPSFPLRFVHTATLDRPAFTLPAEVEIAVEVSHHREGDDDDEQERSFTKAPRVEWKRDDGTGLAV